MREPWLFWTGLLGLVFSGLCFFVGMHVASERTTRRLQVIGQVFAGVSLPIMGYECGFRSTSQDGWELKGQVAVGGSLIFGGIMCFAELIAQAFDKLSGQSPKT